MLPRPHRIAASRDWRMMHARARTVYSRDIVMKFQRGYAAQSRYGFIVGTKVSKRATVRNLIKRRLRAIITKHQRVIRPSQDVVFIARSSIVGIPYATMEQQVLDVLHKARLIQK